MAGSLAGGGGALILALETSPGELQSDVHMSGRWEPGRTLQPHCEVAARVVQAQLLFNRRVDDTMRVTSLSSAMLPPG